MINWYFAAYNGRQVVRKKNYEIFNFNTLLHEQVLTTLYTDEHGAN